MVSCKTWIKSSMGRRWSFLKKGVGEGVLEQEGMRKSGQRGELRGVRREGEAKVADGVCGKGRSRSVRQKEV